MPVHGQETSGLRPCSEGGASVAPRSLPTLQRNAIGLLLNKRDFTPAEVAKLDYQQLERAPRIGKKGIGNIRNWLRQYGLDLEVPAAPVVSQREKQNRRKLALAVEVLTRNGFVVMHESRSKGGE